MEKISDRNRLTDPEMFFKLNKANKRIAIECKVSTAPKVTRGFYSAMEDLDIQEAWVIAPVDEKYPLKENVFVISLPEFLKTEII